MFLINFLCYTQETPIIIVLSIYIFELMTTWLYVFFMCLNLYEKLYYSCFQTF